MTSIRIAYLSNDLGGNEAWPVAAPGLRAQSIAQAIQTKATVRLFCPMQPAQRNLMSFDRESPIRIYQPDELTLAIRKFNPDIIISQNGDHFPLLESFSTAELWCDFFSPRFLEYQAAGRVDAANEELQRFRRSLRSSSRIICNGSRKISLVNMILPDRSDSSDHRISNVPFGIDNPFFTDEYVKEKTLKKLVLLGGYSQDWRDTKWLSTALSILRDHDVNILAFVGNHLGAGKGGLRAPDLLWESNVTLIPTVSLRQYQQILSRVDLFIDLSQESDERYYAMPARTVMALSSGVPVLHPLHTELSELIARGNMGHLMSITDAGFLDQFSEIMERFSLGGLGRFMPPDETSLAATRSSLEFLLAL